MTDNDKVSTLLSDVSVEGDIVEKDKIIIDAKINEKNNFINICFFYSIWNF